MAIIERATWEIFAWTLFKKTELHIGGSRYIERGVPNQLNGCGHEYYIKFWVWFDEKWMQNQE